MRKVESPKIGLHEQDTDRWSGEMPQSIAVKLAAHVLDPLEYFEMIIHLIDMNNMQLSFFWMHCIYLRENLPEPALYRMRIVPAMPGHDETDRSQFDRRRQDE